MRWFVVRFNFSYNLIGNRPQSLTGHIVNVSIQCEKTHDRELKQDKTNKLKGVMTKKNEKKMQHKRLTLSALLLLGLGLTGLQAQTSINATGGNATGSVGTVAYSVGQVVYTSNKGNSGSVDQGVQHAYEILTVGIKETKLNISLTVFPNPTTENLTLQISDYNNEKL